MFNGMSFTYNTNNVNVNGVVLSGAENYNK